MAAPVIDSLTPESAVLSPGQFVDIEVVAHDPDSKAGSVVFPVSDTQGHISQASLALRIDDPISFGVAENPDGLSVSIQKIAEDAGSATYRVTAV